MIKVISLTVVEFRGIRQLKVKFEGKNFVVCGRNGTGKSGIVDALEFALTGNISRLSGEGTGGVSLRKHAPHVDSRNAPDLAYVEVQLQIPSLGKSFTLRRSVKDAGAPIITPANKSAIALLQELEHHAEVVLSRRELIKYIVSTPGNRAKEVQALLRLDQVETLRQNLQKVANILKRSIPTLTSNRDTSRNGLLLSLNIGAWSEPEVLKAVNLRRTILSLEPLTAITAETSIKEGLHSPGARKLPRVSKGQALVDIANIRTSIDASTSEDLANLVKATTAKIQELSKDPITSNATTREQFLQTALNLIDNESCPVCDTSWEPAQLKSKIVQKLKRFEEATRMRKVLEEEVQPVIVKLSSLGSTLVPLIALAAAVEPRVDDTPLRELEKHVRTTTNVLSKFVSLPDTLSALSTALSVPKACLAVIDKISAAVDALPEISDLDQAREFLTIGQEKLEAYRLAATQLKVANEQWRIADQVYQAYVHASTEILNILYKEVESEFSALYRFLNAEDESKFTAAITPSLGKLGFDVDFYERGHFPPGAYHSEGHQDSMGLCLYLALMKHLTGDSFTFAVLDDVLMSIDVGHRRKVCDLLKEFFPNTQFVLTTHDEVWLKLMRTVGLISSRAHMHFRTWSVDHGPTVWAERDVWTEMRTKLDE